eukprot:7183672-Pyramimonas_sp.AAC.1
MVHSGSSNSTTCDGSRDRHGGGAVRLVPDIGVGALAVAVALGHVGGDFLVVLCHAVVIWLEVGGEEFRLVAVLVGTIACLPAIPHKESGDVVTRESNDMRECDDTIRAVGAATMAASGASAECARTLAPLAIA